MTFGVDGAFSSRNCNFLLIVCRLSLQFASRMEVVKWYLSLFLFVFVLKNSKRVQWLDDVHGTYFIV